MPISSRFATPHRSEVDQPDPGPVRMPPPGRAAQQVHLHLNKDFPKVWPAALRIDPTANRRGSESLTRRIARGATVDLFLEGDDFIITEPERQLRWEGTPAIEVFEVKARNNLASDSIRRIVCVSVDDFPVGEVEFNLDVKLTASLRSTKRAKTRATNYKVAFVSYSREDFDAFKLIAHTLETAEYEVLTDANALKSGEEWPKVLPALLTGPTSSILSGRNTRPNRSGWTRKRAMP